MLQTGFHVGHHEDLGQGLIGIVQEVTDRDVGVARSTRAGFLGSGGEHEGDIVGPGIPVALQELGGCEVSGDMSARPGLVEQRPDLIRSGFTGADADAQVGVDAYASAWKQPRGEPGGLVYVALGDSAAQGIGASSLQRGYISLVADRLAGSTGRPVQVINLSSSGARIRDVIEEQLPELA
ncbi:MAG: hypothetical protein KY451_08715, partial [Actinobacteria bacterium]|nr:hypothetical protein [Actinomycetota bacterium]